MSKVTAASSAQVSEFCFHRAIPGMKLSHLGHLYPLYSSYYLIMFQFNCIEIKMQVSIKKLKINLKIF
jgi:hypothetical protein